MWSSGALGDTDPFTLQQTLWWFIATHMGTTGRDEHHKLRFDDFMINMLSSTKNEALRRGQVRLKRAQMQMRELSNKKMRATPDTPSRCPVSLCRAFVQNCPPEMCTPDSPFYLAVNH